MPPEGGQLWRSLHFRPPDPVWAPHGALARVRARLKRYDPYYDVWWQTNNGMFDEERPGRWAVKRWSPQSGCWSTFLIWQTPTGGYRDIDCEDAVVNMTLSGDPDHNGLSAAGVDFGKLSKRIDETNAKLDEKRKRVRRDEHWRLATDQADVQSGKRITISRTDTTRYRTRKGGRVKLC